MTLEQAIAFSIVLGVVGLLVWGRLRYDVAALLGLLAAILTGVVPVERAFEGFGNEILVIVASALVVSAAVERSGVVEALIRPVEPYMRTTGAQIVVLVTAVTALSAFVKNIGALAIFLPIAFQVARRSGTPVSRLLMPLAFGSLIGGVMTQIGTSPNIIVARMRAELLGEPFSMFDFLPVGLGLAVAGVLFLAVGWRLLPAERRGRISDAPFELGDYTTEALLPEGSPFVGKTVEELEHVSDDSVTVISVIRERFRRHIPSGHLPLAEGDILVLEGDPNEIKKLIDKAKLHLIGDKEITERRPDSGEEVGAFEAVVMEGSPLIGASAEQLSLRQRHYINLLAIRRGSRRIAQRLRRVRFQAGDVIVLQGNMDGMPATLAELGCLPLAERKLELGRRRRAWLPVAIMALTMILVATQVAPVPVAFFGAATAVMLFRCLSLREVYNSVEWPILVLLGALIPVSEAIQATGGSDLIADWIAVFAQQLPPVGALGLTLITAMAVTPFLNNAATVLVMAPVAAGLAGKLNLSPDPFLMAVAIGAACDFLTPIGHQCNTLVMGPGGYRFGDYWRLGLPLSIIVALLGSSLIAVVWPLR